MAEDIKPGGKVEAGQTTTEWKAALMAAAVNGLALAVAFGVPINSTQQAALLAFTASTTTLAGLYGIGRGIRKSGTQG